MKTNSVKESESNDQSVLRKKRERDNEKSDCCYKDIGCNYEQMNQVEMKEHHKDIDTLLEHNTMIAKNLKDMEMLIQNQEGKAYRIEEMLSNFPKFNCNLIKKSKPKPKPKSKPKGNMNQNPMTQKDNKSVEIPVSQMKSIRKKTAIENDYEGNRLYTSQNPDSKTKKQQEDKQNIIYPTMSYTYPQETGSAQYCQKTVPLGMGLISQSNYNSCPSNKKTTKHSNLSYKAFDNSYYCKVYDYAIGDVNCKWTINFINYSSRYAFGVCFVPKLFKDFEISFQNSLYPFFILKSDNTIMNANFTQPDDTRYCTKLQLESNDDIILTYSTEKKQLEIELPTETKIIYGITSSNPTKEILRPCVITSERFDLVHLREYKIFSSYSNYKMNNINN